MIMWAQWRIGLGVCCLTLAACSGGAGSRNAPPAQTNAARADAFVGEPAGWTDANRKSSDLYLAGKYAESIAVLDAFAKDHPAFADVELTLGDSYKLMAGKEGADRRALWEKAVVHYRRGLDLASDDLGRDWAHTSLLSLCDTDKLDRPAEAEAAARGLVKDHPTKGDVYGGLAAALRRQQKIDEATKVLREAASRVDDEHRADYAEALVVHADEAPTLPAVEQRQLLADAARVVDPALAAKPNDYKALGIKARMRAVEARLEPDAVKRRKLEAESKRLANASMDALHEAIKD